MYKSNNLADKLCVLAAKSNGNDGQPLTLEQLNTVAQSEAILYPSLNGGVGTTLSENRLTLFSTNSDNVTTPILEIEEVEIILLTTETPKEDANTTN